MARRLGPYAPLSATYAADDAIIAAGEPAELLFCRGLAFCATSNSDGYISDAQLVRLVGVGMKDAPKRAAQLVAVGVWTREDGGYVVRSWIKWNASAEELGRQRARDRDRKANRNPAPIPDGIQTESGGSPNGIHAESNGSPEGFQPRAPAHEAPAPPNHLTPLNSTALNTAAGNELLAEFIDGCRKTPPRDHQRKVGEQIDRLLAEGMDEDDIRSGLELLIERPNLGPSLLPGLVNEAMNAAPAPGSVRRSEMDRTFG